MNKTKITILSIIIVIIAVVIAIWIYKPNKNEEPQVSTTKIAEEEILDDCTDEYEQLQEEILQTNANEVKISPKASITFERVYKKCGHKTSQYSEVSEELVNKTQDELQEKYNDWIIESFSDTEIVLQKEEEGECGEHYIVKEKNGNVVIYEVQEDGTQKEYEVTDISTEYMTETDKMNLEKGIRVNGKQNLNQMIEDFE